MHWMLAPEPESEEPNIDLVADLLSSSEFLASDNQILFLQRKLMVKDDKISRFTQTTGQRQNPLWSAVRKYRLTASNFGSVLKAIQRGRYPPSLFKSLMSTYDLSKKEAIMWGVAHEDEAVIKYKSCGDAVLEDTGIWLHPNGVLGASPDGIIRMPALYNWNYQSEPDTAVIPEVLEVKCPYSARDLSIGEAVRKLKDFFLEFCPEEPTKLRLKTTHSYYDEVQEQLYVTNKSACDFVVWTPRDTAIIRLIRDPLWQQNISKLHDFYFTKFIPHLIQL